MQSVTIGGSGYRDIHRQLYAKTSTSGSKYLDHSVPVSKNLKKAGPRHVPSLQYNHRKTKRRTRHTRGNMTRSGSTICKDFFPSHWLYSRQMCTRLPEVIILVRTTDGIRIGMRIQITILGHCRSGSSFGSRTLMTAEK
jgi:hypothetical protein